jgi:ribosomal protein L2
VSNRLGSEAQPNTRANFPVVLMSNAVKRCHIVLPDLIAPVSAIFYQEQYYSYVKFFPTLEAAQRGANRLIEKGNKVLLTQIPKGFVVWVYELEAKLATKS